MNNRFRSILVLSTGRTGTKFLAAVLKELIPDAVVYHEGGERSRLVNIFFNAYLAGIVPANLALYAWQKKLAPELLQSQTAHSFYIDANNHLYALASAKPELYPGLKVIHIVRDPRTYIRSHLSWSRSRAKSFVANYLTPFWQPTGYLQGNYSLASWLGLSRLERFAWVWDYKNRMINQLEKDGLPYLLVRFEDLFETQEPGETLRHLLDFIGITSEEDLSHYFQKSINSSKQGFVPVWTSWPDQTCQRIDRLCGDLMARYRYGSELAWQLKIGQPGVPF